MTIREFCEQTGWPFMEFMRTTVVAMDEVLRCYGLMTYVDLNTNSILIVEVTV